MSFNVDRRTVLTTGIGAITTTVSGRLGNHFDDENDDISNYDPENTVEQFYEAMNTGNKERLAELSHSQGVAIENAEYYVDNNIQISIRDSEVVTENLDYFSTPSAVVNVSVSFDSEDVVLAVEDGELRVYHRSHNHTVETGDPNGPCPPEDGDDAADNLPRITESFYRVNQWLGSPSAYYRGPDQNRFNVEITIHDTVEDAKEVSFAETHYLFQDESWQPEEFLLARNGAITCEIDVDSSSAADQMEHLVEQTNCFTAEHIVKRTDKDVSEPPAEHESGVDQDVFDAVDQDSDGNITLEELVDANLERLGDPNNEVNGVEVSLEELVELNIWRLTG